MIKTSILYIYSVIISYIIFLNMFIIWWIGFPDAKEVKQLVRDIVAPDMNLGHSDRANKKGKIDQPQEPNYSILDIRDE